MTAPLPSWAFSSRASALNAFAVDAMLLYRRAVGVSHIQTPKCAVARKRKETSERRTARNDDPNEVHEKKVDPKVVFLRATVIETLEVEIKHAGGVV